MEKYLRVFLLMLFAFFLCSGYAFATPYGADITVWDGMSGGTSSWTNTTDEDDEVEPNCQTGQYWDLEGFYLDGATLSMVGGFDFVNGQGGYAAGDIFIDVNGDAEVPATSGGGGNVVVNDTYGYDYVLDMDFATLTYNVIELNSSSTVTVWFGQNEGANPYAYNDGGTNIGSGTIAYATGLSDAAVGGLSGGYHNVAQVDLAFLSGSAFTAHTTIECGNDALTGEYSVPEPSIIILGLTCLFGFAGLGIRRKFKE